MLTIDGVLAICSLQRSLPYSALLQYWVKTF